MRLVIVVFFHKKKNMTTKAFKTQGVCASMLEITLDDEKKIENVAFYGGCHGNTQGIASLVKGMKAEDVISRLEGIRCGMKVTSCPDQLAKALKEMI